MSSFIVKVAMAPLSFYQRRTLYALIQSSFPNLHADKKRFDRIIDIYVLCWFVLSFLAFLLATSGPDRLISIIIILVACHRIGDIITFLLRLFLSSSGTPMGRVTIASRARSFIMILMNYFEISAWFGAIYTLMIKGGWLSFENSEMPLISIMRESMLMMTLGTAGVFSTTSDVVVNVVFIANAVIGLFMTTVVVAFAVNLLVVPATED